MSADFFDKLIGRTRGRWSVAVPKFETLLSLPRGNGDALPELACGEEPAHAGELRSEAEPRDGEPLALLLAPEPTPVPTPEPPPQPTLQVTIAKIELHAAPEPRDRRA
jgi:hypothetical protein